MKQVCFSKQTNTYIQSCASFSDKSEQAIQHLKDNFIRIKRLKTIAVVLIILITGVMAESQNLKLNAQKSTIEWTGKKTLGMHKGKIALLSGSLISKDQVYSGGEFVVDMKSITCDDLTDATTNAQLVGHLKSDDFFGVETFPTAKLVIKSVKLKEKNNFEFTGDLTIKGITNPVKFDAVLSSVNQGVNFSGKLIVDRSKYNVRYGSGSFFDNLGDKVIYDEFELTFNVSFEK